MLITRLYYIDAPQKYKKSFQAKVKIILTDPKGWRRANIDFVETSDKKKTLYVITLAPNKFITKTCGFKNMSCTIMKHNICFINLQRWLSGSPHSNMNLNQYRYYVVNHEVGHMLDLDDYFKKAKGQEIGTPGPVMVQHTLGNNGFLPNCKPTTDEISKVMSIKGGDKINKFSNDLKKYIFPKTTKSKLKKLQVHTSTLYSISSPKHAEQLMQIIMMYLNISKKTLSKMSIMDSSANVGGNTYAMIDYFGCVYAVELCTDIFKSLKHNISILKGKTKNVVLINDNYLNVYKKTHSNIVFLDPPWGNMVQMSKGVDLYYSDHKHKVCMPELVQQLLSKSRPPSLILIKVPKYYDYKNFKSTMSKYHKKIYIDKLHITDMEDKLVYYILTVSIKKPHNIRKLKTLLPQPTVPKFITSR